jgi:hypothetical protein
VKLGSCRVRHVKSVAGEGVAVIGFAPDVAHAQSWVETVLFYRSDRREVLKRGS